jgi:integrase
MRTPSSVPGRHPYQRLNAVSLRTKQAPGRYADGNGLYLVVEPSGAKRWIWRGVIKSTGKRCDLGLGGVAYVSLSEAREKARTYRHQARSGGNPKIDHTRARRPVPTFRTIAIEVHAAYRPHFKNAKHVAVWLQSLEKHVFPVIGDLPITAITRDSGHVLQVLKPIWMSRPETARRVKQRLKLVFDWAKAHGHHTGDNPTEGLTKVLPTHTDKQQHLKALAYGQVPTFVTTLQTHPDTSDLVRLALELLILTATRTTEILHATWTEIDLEQRVWTIPGARMKSGREHRIPLSPRAVKILEHVQRLTASQDSTWLFPGSKPGQTLSNMTLLKAAHRIAGKTPITTHGFRSSFRDWCEERTTTPQSVAEAALAHVVPDKTEAAYRRTDLFDRRRDLMDLWAQFVTTTPAKVLAHTA